MLVLFGVRGGVGQAHAGWRALPWLTVRVLDEPVPKPVRLRHTRSDEGPVSFRPLKRSDSKARSGAEEGEDGEHPAMLVGRLGQVELLEDLGDVGFDGAFGDIQPGGDGPVGHALGD
jgi:hypothetical protein